MFYLLINLTFQFVTIFCMLKINNIESTNTDNYPWILFIKIVNIMEFRSFDLINVNLKP